MTTKTKTSTANVAVIKTSDGCRIELPQATLAAALRRVLFAADIESTRYALAGVRVEVMPDRITFVATDGNRLAY